MTRRRRGASRTRLPLQEAAATLALFMVVWASTLFAAPADQGGAGKAQEIFDQALTYLLRRNTARAMELFAQAERAGKEFGELAVLYRIRLVGTEKRPDGQSRAAEVRGLLAKLKTPESVQMGWFLGAVSLYESQERQAALAMAVESGRRFEGTRWGAASRFLAAEIFYQNNERSAALELLLLLLEKDGQGPFADDACYLLGRIYAEPGQYHSPRRATHVLRRFATAEKPYRDSIWRARALELLREVAAAY